MDGLDNFLSTLGVAFDAAVAREEETAASDLAVSLLQDRDLRDVLLRGGPWRIVRSDGGRVPLEVVGVDFVGGASLVVPLKQALVAATVDGARAHSSAATLREVLRGWARAGRDVALGHGSGEWRGRVTVCGRDYLGVAAGGREVLVPLASLSWVRLEGDGNASP